MKYFQTFYVEGTSPFPLDMLRYDNCFPADQESVEQMTPNGLAGIRLVRLKRYISTKDQMPTSARWASFGWKVLPNTSTIKI